MIARALLLAALALAPSCASFHPFGLGGGTIPPQESDILVKRAEAELAAGDSTRALADLRKARDAEQLTSDQKNRIDILLERCAEARISALSAPGSDPDELKELFDLNLPRQIAITAGVRAARMMLDQGEPIDAYEMIQKVDKRYPPAGTHHERKLAGDVLFEAGMKLAKSNFSILGLFSDKDDAKGVLEYLVQNYPQERRCDQAYRELATLYEHDRVWATAIERHQDLVTYHLDSPLAPESEWRIPHLRLVALRRPDYDRRELLRALGELEAWLESHAGTEFEPRVIADRTDCLKRLAESDLMISHFYAHVKKWDGARIHAERALGTSKRSGDAQTIAKAEAAVALVPTLAPAPLAPTKATSEPLAPISGHAGDSP
jgi:tetratricopeptide (TPR) repeat protein